MRLIDAQQRLLKLNEAVLQTNEVATCLKISITHASHILNRLAKAGTFVKLCKGVFATSNKLDPFILAEYLTSPFPSYISLQTALYHHGMISQIPAVIYAISLARTKRFNTNFGTIAIHHVQPDFFFGFDLIPKTQIKIATPEKALLDVLYLFPTRSHLFRALPEIEIPKNFNVRKIKVWLNKISSKQRATIINNHLKKILGNAGVTF